jgi:Ca-activated chloride channel family protein
MAIEVFLLTMKFLSANIHWAYLIISLLILPATGFADSFDSKAQEGVTHYNREEFDQAADKFQASQLEQPDNSNVAYNLANSHYRLGRYEEAVEAYKKALSEKTPPMLQQKSYYNMGNAYYRMGYMDEAIDSYKKALELNTGDMDSKFNLEWARKQQEKARQAGRIGPRDKDILKQQATSDHANNPADPQEKSGESPDNESEKSKSPQTAENKHQDNPDSRDTSPPAPTPAPPSEKEMKAKADEQSVQQKTRPYRTLSSK